MTAYPLLFETLTGMGRDKSEVEASASLSLLIARLGNVSYNVIAILFALNLYDVSLTPVLVVEFIVCLPIVGVRMLEEFYDDESELVTHKSGCFFRHCYVV